MAKIKLSNLLLSLALILFIAYGLAVWLDINAQGGLLLVGIVCLLVGAVVKLYENLNKTSVRQTDQNGYNVQKRMNLVGNISFIIGIVFVGFLLFLVYIFLGRLQ